MTHSIDLVNTGRSGLYRTFTEGEYDLDCPFKRSAPVIDIGTQDYALWSLFADRSDLLGNYDNLVLCGEDEDVAYPFKSFFFDGKHWLQTPTTTAGMDLEGLLKVDGVANSPYAAYGIGFHLLNSTFPSPGTYRWFFFAGNANHHLGFRVMPDGRGEYVRKAGATTYTLQTISPLQPQKWHAVYITHDQQDGTKCGMYVDGVWQGTISTQMVMGAPQGSVESTPFIIGKGPVYNFTETPTTWNTNTAHPKYFFTDDFLTIYSDTTQRYGCAAATGVLTEENKYYWEVKWNSGTYLWLGVTEKTTDMLQSPGTAGWSFATHNGRRFDHQTGGGTTWKGAMAIGDIIGFAYDGVAKTLTIYRNGALYGTLPYTIPGEIVPFMGSDKDVNITLRPMSDTWSYSPPDGTYVPLPLSEQVVDGGDAPLFKGRGRLLRIIKGMPSAQEITTLSSTDIVPQIYAKTISGTEYDLSFYVYKWYEDRQYIGIKTPAIPTGFYTIYSNYNGVVDILRRVNIRGYQSQVFREYVLDDFTSPTKTLEIWDTAHKAWGGENGGVASNLIKIQPGKALMYAHGDLYTGSKGFGVDRLGAPTGRKTRVGSCLVSKRYFGPGRFRFRVKLPLEVGACAAIWTFHYEEAYPGDDLWQEFLKAGLHRAGDEELGHWIVRNHEIDIETPSAAKTDADQEAATYSVGRFNTWLGEQRNWNVPNNDVPTHDPMYSDTNHPDYWSEYTDTFVSWPKPVADDMFHDFVIDWSTDPMGVSFYVDDMHIVTNTTHIPDIPMKIWIGLWFPSAATKWAGSNASWGELAMEMSEFEYTPYSNHPVYLASESYPNVGIRPLTLEHFTGWGE